MNMRNLILGLAFLLLLAQSPSVAAAQSSHPVGLPNCVGKPEIRPKEVILTCADAGITARNLRWTGWGESFAAAMGTMSVNDCKPYCAAGHFHNYPVILVATGNQRCPNGMFAYRSVTYAYIGKGPSSGNSTYDFPCARRR